MHLIWVKVSFNKFRVPPDIVNVRRVFGSAVVQTEKRFLSCLSTENIELMGGFCVTQQRSVLLAISILGPPIDASVTIKEQFISSLIN